MTNRRPFVLAAVLATVLAAVLGAGLVLTACGTSTSGAPGNSPTAEPSSSGPPSASTSALNMSGGLYLLIRNRTQSVWRCFDYVEEYDPIDRKKVKKQRELFVLQPGQEGRYGNQSKSGVDIDHVDCSVRSGNLYGLHLYLRADNPWYASPWMETSLVDNRRDVPAGSCFNNSKCAVWGTKDSFSKEGTREVHRFPGGGYDLTLWRGRKDGDKNIEIHVDMDAP